MIEIAGTTYYMVFGLYLPCFVGCLLLAACIVVLLPINRFVMKRKMSFVKILGISLVLALTGAIYLFKDVYFIGRQAKKLCAEEGGLRIYRTVEVDTIVRGPFQPDLREVKRLLEQGYSSIEGELYNPLTKLLKDESREERLERLNRKKYRFTLENGEVKKQPITEYSREAMRYGPDGEVKILNRAIKKTTRAIKDRYTGERLSEATFFSIYPGKVESRIVGMSGFTFTPWFCGDRGVGFREKTIQPRLNDSTANKPVRGEQK
jgi:hypothetical protein